MNGRAAHPRPAFVLRVLGVVDLRTPGGTELDAVLAQPKRLALLAYLLLSGPRSFHRRDSLLGIFWPELDQARARAALRQALHFLRQALGAETLISRGTEEIGVAPHRIRCDVTDFEHALATGDRDSAVQAYGGAFLEGLYVSEAPEFERWVERERERHLRGYIQASHVLAAEARARGDLDTAVTHLRRLVEHEPYLATTTLQLMEVLDATGDRAAALAHSQAFTDRVRKDLELDPDPSVSAYADRLRRTVTVSQSTAPLGHAEEIPTPTVAEDDGIRAGRFHGKRRRRTVAVFASITALLSVAWIVAVRAAPFGTGEPTRASIAIMPFGVRVDSSMAHVAHGLGRAVVRSLRDLRGVRVLGPEETRGIVSDAGLERRSTDELNVQYVLRSEIVASEEVTMRIGVVLIRALSRDTVLRDTIETAPEDLTTVHGRLAARIADAMEIDLLPSERRLLSAPVTGDPVAYDLYLRGNQRLGNAVTRGDELLAAVDLLEGAVERDTSFALAYSQLAVAHLSLYWWHRDRTPERLAAAKRAADAVMRLRPDLPDAHLAMGWFHYWGRLDYDRALSHFEMARATRSPNSDLMILLAAMRRRQGDWSGSTGIYEQALADNPTCAWCAMDLGYSLLVLGRYGEASAAFRQAVTLSPDFFYGQVFGALLEIAWRGDTTRARAWVHHDRFDANEIVQTGTRHWSVLGRVLGPRYDEALRLTRLTPAVDDTADYYLAKAQLYTRREEGSRASAYYDSAVVWLEPHAADRSGDARTHALLGVAYAGQGRAEAAIAAGHRAVELLPPARDAMDGPLWMVRLAEIYVQVGRFDAAVDLLEQVVGMPSWVTPALLRVDPVWAPLWGHDRFERLASSP